MHLVVFIAFFLIISSSAQELLAQELKGLRGDSVAINDAVAMVEAMGGMAIWNDIESVHFVHEWDIMNRHDRYLENEILDLTGPRSYVTMDSEVSNLTRAYSPEHKYWRVVNGEFSYGNDVMLENAIERAPYSIYRLARAIARGDDYYRVEFGSLPDTPEH